MSDSESQSEVFIPNNRDDYITVKQKWLVTSTTWNNSCCCIKEGDLTKKCQMQRTFETLLKPWDNLLTYFTLLLFDDLIVTTNTRQCLPESDNEAFHPASKLNFNIDTSTKSETPSNK